MARRFAKIKPSVWRTSKMRQLEGAEKLVAIYLMANEYFQMVGIYRLPIALIQADLQLDEERIWKALDKLIAVDFCRYDCEQEVVWVVDMAATQVADNPNEKQLKGVKNEITRLFEEEYPFLKEWLDFYHEQYNLDADMYSLCYTD